MKVAIVGCAHGELDKIYDAVEYMQTEKEIKIDLLLCCGDFQAVRNHGDLMCMAVPPKYRQMNSFYKYYSGQLKAPVLTVFVGGNHEASNYLSELPYGGWVAPNIYYLGLAGVVRFGNLRLGGVSGIFKGQDYLKGHFERPPYSQDTIRSVYHVRNLEIFRLQQLTNSTIDVFLSHDWPRGIHGYGNEQYLFKRKPYFREEAERNSLGSPPLLALLNKLMPTYWFSAHMHVKFSALYQEPSKTEGQSSVRCTKFLALDKCLPRRDYLQILDLPGEISDEFPAHLTYDREWLAVLKSTDHLLKVSRGTVYMPGPGCDERYDFRPTADELAEIDRIFDKNFAIPNSFRPTAPGHFDGAPKRQQTPCFAVNSQTMEFCNKLKITNLNSVLAQGQQQTDSSSNERFDFVLESNPDEILFDEDDEDHCPCAPASISSGFDSAEEVPLVPVSSIENEFSSEKSTNPDEISIDNDDDSEDKEPKGGAAAESLPVKQAGQNDNVVSNYPFFKRRNAAMYCETKDDD